MNEEVTVAMAAVGERKAVRRGVAMREKKEERAGERERERERVRGGPGWCTVFF